MSLGLERSRYGLEPIELYEFVQGASAWRYTSGDVAVKHLGHLYAPCAISRGPVRHTEEAGSGSLDVTLPRTDPLVAQLVGYLPPSAIALTVHGLQRQSALGEVVFVGEIASFEHRGAVATLRCVSVEALLARSAPGLAYQSQCNWVLYGTGCGVSAEAFRVAGTVTRVERHLVHVRAARARPDGWYRAGWMQTASGERRFIVAHAGEQLTLNHPFKTLAPGDAVSLFAGCQHTETECREKYDNLVHFLGFPRMPARNPFTGTI